jgi:hypothetical protein
MVKYWKDGLEKKIGCLKELNNATVRYGIFGDKAKELAGDKQNITMGQLVKSIKSKASFFNVTRQSSSDEIDRTGTPATNNNYGKPKATTPITKRIEMSVQHLSDDDTKGDNYIHYEKRGYDLRGAVKILALSTLKEKDTLAYSDGYTYKVVEKTDRHLPKNDNSGYEYVYTQALALKQENQGQ